MNRPKIRDFIKKCELPNCTVINIGSLNVVSYQNALNEYIDYLEEQLSNLRAKNEVEHQQNELLCKKVNELDKALDRACKRLSYENEITCMHLKQQYAWAKNKVPKTKEQIKEELMKDDL